MYGLQQCRTDCGMRVGREQEEMGTGKGSE